MPTFGCCKTCRLTWGAIVIVNYITIMPTWLHEVLPRFTTMPVGLITESLRVESNRVFIIPANSGWLR